MVTNRQIWGWPDGIPEGSDFTLEGMLTLNGAKDSNLVTSSGTYTLSISDSVLNGGTALLTDETSDSVSLANAGTKVVWNITNVQSSGWEAGTYKGDIKLVDSGSKITYWPVTYTSREVRD